MPSASNARSTSLTGHVRRQRPRQSSGMPIDAGVESARSLQNLTRDALRGCGRSDTFRDAKGMGCERGIPTCAACGALLRWLEHWPGHADYRAGHPGDDRRHIRGAWRRCGRERGVTPGAVHAGYSLAAMFACGAEEFPRRGGQPYAVRPEGKRTVLWFSFVPCCQMD